MFKNMSKSLKWLVILVIATLAFSLGASLVQNSFFSVKVDKISFETERGELSGYLYTPRGVDASHPAPAVVLTHGYLNNSEMQEIGAIELSRRGYVVLAFDMYDHGDSTWDTPSAFNFYVYSMFDAVTYMYAQDYVLKDANGNGMIGVSGHSMGGFSSEYAVIFDEMQYAVSGHRMIAASLAVGADFRYIFTANPETYFQTRSSGVIAAHYDQFFFDNSGTSAGSVVYKDYTEDAVGLAFLGRTTEGEAEAGVFYSYDGGQRVIYTPNETHPQDTWSLESGKYTIEFFEEAFSYQLTLHGLQTLSNYGVDTGSTTQVWWLKEAFTLLALVSLFVMLFPLFALISKLPVFKHVYANGEALVEQEVKLSPEKKGMKWIVISISTLLTVFFITLLMDRSADLINLANAMYYLIGAVVLVLGAIWIFAILSKDDHKIKMAQKVSFGGLTIILLALAFRWFLNNTQIISNVIFWSAPSVNTIVYWAIGNAFLIFLIVFSVTPAMNAGEEVINPYGLKASSKQVGASFLTALALTIAALFLVALVGWIFLTDFRFYTYAIQIFNSHQFVAALKYMPLFFIYYLAASVTVFVNSKGMKGWKADLLSAFLLAGPVIIFLVYQYGVLYTSGVAAYPTFSLSAILCVGLIPTLSVAGILMRRISQKTGNVWTSVFFTTLFFTLITLANTAVYALSIA